MSSFSSISTQYPAPPSLQIGIPSADSGSYPGNPPSPFLASPHSPGQLLHQRYRAASMPCYTPPSNANYNIVYGSPVSYPKPSSLQSSLAHSVSAPFQAVTQAPYNSHVNTIPSLIPSSFPNSPAFGMIHGQGSFNQHPRTISDGGAADQGLAYDDYDDNEDDEDDEEEWDFEQHEEQGEEQGEGEWEGLDAPVDTPGEWVSREDFGGRKSHGYFACSCGKWWYSAHTFRDFVQGCLQCEVGSLPLAMWVDFEEEEEEEEEEEHIQSNYCRVCEQEDSHGNYCQACGRSECQEYDDNNGGYNDYDEY